MYFIQYKARWAHGHFMSDHSLVSVVEQTFGDLEFHHIVPLSTHMYN